MILVLKPCPFCESDLVEGRSFLTEGPNHYVFCKSCGVSGPLGQTADEAARLWNSGPRRWPWRIPFLPTVDS